MDTNKSLSTVSKTMLAIQSEKAINVPKTPSKISAIENVIKKAFIKNFLNV